MGLIYQSRNRFVVESLSYFSYIGYSREHDSREEVWEPQSWHESESEAVNAAKEISTEHEQVRVRTMNN